MRVAVIGLGAAGSAVLRFLARAGHETVGFEQFRIGHDRGSSHGESRIIRYLYSDPFYTGLMGHAFPLWRELETDAGTELIVRTGGVFIGPRDHPDIAATQSSLDKAERPYDLLDSEAAMARFPAFRMGTDEVALYEGETGFLRASDCLRANIRLACAGGAEVREEEAVASVESAGAGVRVVSGHGNQIFDRVVVTAGPWMGKLLQDLRLPLQVTRQYVAYLRTGTEDRDANATGQPWPAGDSRSFPSWIDVGSPKLYYGIPHDGRIAGIKIGLHAFGPVVDADAQPGPVPADLTDRMRDYATGRFTEARPEVTQAIACRYTVTPDEDFILDEIQAGSGIWMVSGCSGHGFKFSVLLGKIAADLATGGQCGIDIGRFSLARFH
jgi:sarcosine oxidase